VIELDGRPVGMIQVYLASDYPEWDAVVQAGEGVAAVDLLIGDEELIGGGLGPKVLAEFARRVVFADPGTTACMATVEESNRRSWRAFEKAGFRYVRDVVEDGIPCRLLWVARPDGPA
jgi:aminoglycoside 6'-N-acetyltransferase